MGCLRIEATIFRYVAVSCAALTSCFLSSCRTFSLISFDATIISLWKKSLSNWFDIFVKAFLTSELK